jgi:hypothetical protein
MDELFERFKNKISVHFQNLFEEGELNPNSVIRKFRSTVDDVKTYSLFLNNRRGPVRVTVVTKSAPDWL